MSKSREGHMEGLKEATGVRDCLWFLSSFILYLIGRCMFFSSSSFFRSTVADSAGWSKCASRRNS